MAASLTIVLLSMAKTRLSTKGQITIPREIRKRHGWAPGVQLGVEDHGDHVVLRQVEDLLPETTLDDLVGCTGYQGPARSLEEMDAAAALAIKPPGV